LVRQELIIARLERLREYIVTLKAILKYDVDKFKADVFVHVTAERYLQLSIECLLDIGNHIISDRGYRKPDTYAEIFEILAEEKIISKKLLRELEGMAAFAMFLCMIISALISKGSMLFSTKNSLVSKNLE
jgi:uncharacterized protein YutE (UPF0331/DUF86 family)